MISQIVVVGACTVLSGIFIWLVSWSMHLKDKGKIALGWAVCLLCFLVATTAFYCTIGAFAVKGFCESFH